MHIDISRAPEPAAAPSGRHFEGDAAARPPAALAWASAPTIEARIAASGGRTTGFDTLRIALAITIVLWHGISVSYGRATELSYWRAAPGLAMHFVLPLFFALSGFLVAGSLDRCRSLVSFFCLRALRIIPALGVEILLSALIFGPLLTTLPLNIYVSSPAFFAYFLNLAGDVHFALPGVFAENPLPGLVNAQLWTIPFELQCYLALGSLALTAALRRRAILLAMVLAAQALWIWHGVRLGDTGGSGGASGPILVIAFLAGILMHLYRDRIRLHWAIFLVVFAAGLALSGLPHGAYWLPLPCAYITVYLGTLNPPRPALLRSGDYSYGIFLYGYPIQQAVASYGPAARHWWINVGIALPLAVCAAALSWHFIERPVLSLRSCIPALESRLLKRFQAPPRRKVSALGILAGILGFFGTLLFVNADMRSASGCVLAAFALALLEKRLVFFEKKNQKTFAS